MKWYDVLVCVCKRAVARSLVRHISTLFSSSSTHPSNSVLISECVWLWLKMLVKLIETSNQKISCVRFTMIAPFGVCVLRCVMVSVCFLTWSITKWWETISNIYLRQYNTSCTQFTYTAEQRKENLWNKISIRQAINAHSTKRWNSLWQVEALKGFSKVSFHGGEHFKANNFWTVTSLSAWRPIDSKRLNCSINLALFSSVFCRTLILCNWFLIFICNFFFLFVTETLSTLVNFTNYRFAWLTANSRLQRRWMCALKHPTIRVWYSKSPFTRDPFWRIPRKLWRWRWWMWLVPR